MGLIAGKIGYEILKRISKDGENSYMDGRVYANTSKLETLFGPQFWDTIKNKTVVDFGCGAGTEAVEMAKRGAKTVIGLDIQKHLLQVARAHALRAGMQNRCSFKNNTDKVADVIVPLDSFEHFGDPLSILHKMSTMLNRRGCILFSFGPALVSPARRSSLFRVSVGTSVIHGKSLDPLAFRL